MKNAYDWLSISLEGEPPVAAKPSGVISVGKNGGVKVQEHFKRVARYRKVKIMEHTVMVNEEPANFDDHGNLVSEGYKGDLKTFLSHLNEFLVASKQ